MFTYRIKNAQAESKPFAANSPEEAIRWARENTLFRCNTDEALRKWLQVIANGVWVYVD